MTKKSIKKKLKQVEIVKSSYEEWKKHFTNSKMFIKRSKLLQEYMLTPVGRKKILWAMSSVIDKSKDPLKTKTRLFRKAAKYLGIPVVQVEQLLTEKAIEQFKEAFSDYKSRLYIIEEYSPKGEAIQFKDNSPAEMAAIFAFCKIYNLPCANNNNCAGYPYYEIIINKKRQKLPLYYYLVKYKGKFKIMSPDNFFIKYNIIQNYEKTGTHN